MKYADAHGVLMVHAAGNDGADLSKRKSFPTPAYLDGGHPQNWIEVGASSWKGGDSLAATSRTTATAQVDVFAPGVDILSTHPRQSVRAGQRHEHGGAGRERARGADHGLLPEPDRGRR